MQSTHRLVNFLFFLMALLLALLPIAAAFAQKPVKTEIIPLFDKVPAPPTVPNCTLKLPAGFADLERQVAQLSQTIASSRTAEQSKEEADMKAVSQRVTEAGVENMSEAQKLAYMQQAANIPGSNAQAVQLAQQMQDPAFTAKFSQMSDVEKAQYLQKQMAAPGSTQQRMVNNPAFQAAQADFMQQMQNPGFRAAWEKKSEAEQDAYMQQLMRKHGLDETQLKAVAGPAKTTAPLAPLVATAAMEANAKLAGIIAAEANSPDAFLRLQQQLQASLEAVSKEAAARPRVEAREGDCQGQQRNYDQYRSYQKQRLDLMAKYMPQLAAAWQARKKELIARSTPFQTELAKIHYGDDIKRPQEKAFVSSLAGGQQLMLQEITQLAGYSQAIYELNSKYCELTADYNKPFKCELATCFPPSARVNLPDGRQVHISRIRPGDEVLGYDAAMGRLRPVRVQRVDIHSDHDYALVQLTIGTPAVYADLGTAAALATPAIKLLMTPNHPIITADRQALRADQLQPSDEVLRLNENEVETTHLADRQPAGTAWEVYNLRTETGNYFVSGVLVGSK
ncbi:Hint domain-containing protein [Hymenobacter cavernae]|uniref:Hint domain-containing protein n=1 Tax=Hymenobacter cavernae TaxID=2044852 RepID=A0ABQ1UPZ2_9BACT|nr:Hint domain-containing protein [Hymenobacter cavernae]GGF23678.1 hypothetical protein GCM10011383_39180 [Hymenobacter cavernae]